ncbi:serine-rich adhesin for platelets isoform X2 [Hetaerina americana]|uniref:serine-rich adhesin for platelets isoform X2 n=1 Tax=Hetaerina americana TaxID=62018 RepID=UPI003A7F5A14
MAGKISSPANINKNPNIIIAAQKEMATVDVLVCGLCHSVFHIIEEFVEHKSKKECNQSNRIPAKVESTATVWAYLLWKSNYLEEMKAKGTPCKLTSWDIYQIWHNSPIESRNSWIKAGRAMQASQVIGKGVLQEVPKKEGPSLSNALGKKREESNVHIIVNNQGKVVDPKGKVLSAKRTDVKDQGKSSVTDVPSKAGLVKKSLETKGISLKKTTVIKDVERARKTIVYKDSEKGKTFSTVSETFKRKISESEDTDGDNEVVYDARQLMQPVRNVGRPKGVQMESLVAEEYAVEKILAKRFNHRWKRYEYWIKWEGYSMDQNTWEPAKNLSTCQDLMEEFERKELEREKAERMEFDSEGKDDLKEALDDEIELHLSDTDMPPAVKPSFTRSEKPKIPSDVETPPSTKPSVPASGESEFQSSPESSDTITPTVKSTRGRKLGSKNKVKEFPIATPSSSGRPSRNSKQKALSQVKLWCGLKRKIDVEETVPTRRRRAGSRGDEDEIADIVVSKKQKLESRESENEKTPKQVNSSKKTVKDEPKSAGFSKLAPMSTEKSGQDSSRKGKDSKGDTKKIEMPLIKLVKNVSVFKNVKTPKTQSKIDERNEIAAKAEEERRRKEKEMMMGSAEKAIALMRELTADRPDWDEILDGKEGDSDSRKDDDELPEKIDLGSIVSRVDVGDKSSKLKFGLSSDGETKDDTFAPVVTKVESRVTMEHDPPPDPTSPVRDVKERTFTLLLGSESPSTDSKGISEDAKSPKQSELSPGANGGKKKEIFILPKLKEVLKDAKLPAKGEGSKNLVIGKQRGSLARLMMTVNDQPVEAPRKRPPNILSASHSSKVPVKPLTHFIAKPPQTRLLPVLVNADSPPLPPKTATTTPVTKTFITRNPIQVSAKDPAIKLNPVKVISNPKGKVQMIGQVSQDGSQVSVLRTVHNARGRLKPAASKGRPLAVKKLDSKPLPPSNSSSGSSSSKGSTSSPVIKERRLSDSGSVSSSESEADPFDNLPPLDEMTSPKRDDSPPPPLTLCPLTGMLLDDDGKPMPPPVVEKKEEEKSAPKDTESLECSVSDLLLIKSSNKSGDLNQSSIPTETPSIESDSSSVFMQIVNECTGDTHLDREGTEIAMDASSSGEGSSSTDHLVSTIEIPVSGLGMPVASIEVPVTSIGMPVTSIEMPVASIDMPVSSVVSSSAKIDGLLKEAVLDDERSMQMEVGSNVGKEETKVEGVLQLDVTEGVVGESPEVPMLPVDCAVGDDVGEIMSVDAEVASEPSASGMFLKQGEEIVSEAQVVGSVEGANGSENRRVVLLLPDGQVVLTEVNEQQYASLDFDK